MQEPGCPGTGESTVPPNGAAVPETDADAAWRRGADLVGRSALREAVPVLQQAVRLQSDHLPALVLLGSTLRKLGNAPAGDAALRAALERCKPDFKLLFDLGNMLREAECYAAAITAYDGAIERRPRSVSAHYNRAICLRRLERLDEAIAGYRQVVELDPNHAKAYNNLGDCLRRHHQPGAAERALRKAIELEPEWFAPRYNLGRALYQLARHGEALVALKQALRLDPGHADACLRLGLVQQEIGQLDAARASYRRALELSPDLPGAHSQLAQLDPTPLDPAAVERLERKLAADDGTPENRRHLHFALAHRYEQVEEYGRAFDHLVEGNRLMRAGLVYDVDEDLRLLADIARIHTRAFLDRYRGAGDPSPRPIFVVGMARSGTTLIEQILASHSLVHGAGEITALRDVLQTPLKESLSDDAGRVAAALGPAALNRMAAAYLGELRRLVPQAPRVVDKFLFNLLYIGLIQIILPNARIVHARRHPLDNCVAMFRKQFVGGLAFTYDLAELGAVYAAYARLMRHWHEVLPGVILDVRYEDMVADQRATTARILAHCGLAWEDSCLRFYETQRQVRTASLAQVRRPIYRGASGIWRRYGDRLQPLIDALGDEAVASGYPEA